MNKIFQRLVSLQLLRHTSAYIVTSVLNAGINFGATLIYSRMLHPSEFGVFSVYMVLLNFFMVFAGISLHGAMSRRYFDRDEVDFPGYVGTCLALVVLTSCLSAILMLVFKTPVSRISGFPAEWLWLVVVGGVGQFLLLTMLGLAQSMERPQVYGAFQLGATLIGTAASVALLYWSSSGWESRGLGYVSGLAAVAVASLAYLMRAGVIASRLDLSHARHAIRYGLPFLPHMLSWWVIGSIDRILMANKISLEQVGLYAVALQFAQVFALGTDAINKAWVPWLFKRLKQNIEGDKALIVKVIYLYAGALCALGVLFWGLASFFIRVVLSSSYHGAVIFIGWLTAAYVVEGLYKMIVNFIFYEEKTNLLARCSLATALFHVGICYVLIDTSGAIGGAQALLCAYLAILALTWTVSNRMRPMPWFSFLATRGGSD